MKVPIPKKCRWLGAALAAVILLGACAQQKETSTPSAPSASSGPAVTETTEVQRPYGRTQVRGNEERHWDPTAGDWGPWHSTMGPHEPQQVVSRPAPAPAPAPRAADGTATRYLGFPFGTIGSTGQIANVLLQISGPTQVAVGEEYEYVMVVTNNGDAMADEVVVHDKLQGVFEMTGSEPSHQVEDGKNVWRLGEMKPGDSRTIKVRGRATGAGSIMNCATVTYVPYACIVTNVVEPALRLVKSAPSQVVICDEIPIRYVVSNTGSGIARAVVVNDTLPEGLTVNNSRQVRVDVGDLGPGESKEATVTANAARTGVLGSEATASSGALRSESEAATRVTQPVLAITKSATELLYLGRDITYQISVSNSGDAAAANAVLTDTLPEGVEFVSASAGGTAASGRVTWNLGSIAPGADRSVTLTVRPLRMGDYRNSAAVTADCATAVNAVAVSEVRGIPAILLEVVDVQDPIQVGENVTYVITVTNQGSAPGQNIRVQATLEASMQYVGSEGATTARADGVNITMAPLANLAVGAQATWRVTVRAAQAGDVRFGVSMTEDQLGRPVTETEATNFYQ